ncbi:MAG: response regulator transcription factor [Burkholderiales bacterium]|nr:response regulator transcription factor [Burkholderiales bacterium]
MGGGVRDLPNESLKILVVDDHALIREALRSVLKQLDAKVAIFESATCAEAFKLADANPDLDLCLLDLHLPGLDGFAGLAELRRRHPAIAIVVLSASDDRADVTRAFNHGAVGFIPKSSPCSVMLSALDLVLAGGVYLPQELLSTRMPAAQPAPAPVYHVTELGLTERQREVLMLMIQGKPNKIICRDMGLAEGTVKIHVTAILKALHATSRTQAVLAAGQLDFSKAVVREGGKEAKMDTASS